MKKTKEKMEIRYEVLLPSGTIRLIRPEDEYIFFRAIRNRTALDQPMAKAILDSGSPIVHFEGTFRLHTPERIDA